jgi:hypothetical protein
MLTKNVGKITLVLVGLQLFLFVSLAFAVVIHDTVRYEQPVRAIRGRVTMGDAIAVVWVDVYDNAQACLDSSMPPFEKRKRQTKIASVEPSANGEFNIRHLPKGLHEVEFGNRGMGGYDILSVLVNVDPKGTKDRLCVNLGLEGGSGGSRESRVAKCSAKQLAKHSRFTNGF